MDGGTIWNVDPFSAINQCLEVVDSEEDIIMDIAICGDYEMSTESKLGRNSIYEFMRGHTIKSFYSNVDEIADAMRAFPGINYRHLFLEKVKLTGPSELDFRNETTWPYQMEGRQDAQDQLNAEKNGFNGFMALSEWNEDHEGVQSLYKNFEDYFRAKFEAALNLI